MRTTSVWKATGNVRIASGGRYDNQSTLLVADDFHRATELAAEALAWGWGSDAEVSEIREITRVHEDVRLQVGRHVAGDELW